MDPTSRGAQPMVDEASGCSVVYNGEIYNTPALRRQLEAHGHQFRTGTDTEVLLVGWVQWGSTLLERIEGMFSFALLNERTGVALLARDRMGVKPLYWSTLGGELIAGSAPRALLVLRPELGAVIDRTAIAQFLSLLWIPHPRSPWQRVHKLPPGCALSFDGGTVRQWRYWAKPKPPPTVTAAELRDRLSKAVRSQLLSDVPVGVLFSGGLDSSVLLALMRRHLPDERLPALSAGFAPSAQRYETVPDDLGYATSLARGLPAVDFHPVVLGGDTWRGLDELAVQFDDPVADPAAITMYRLAQASPAKVLLSGVGAEELFAGYGRHRALPLARRLARLPPSARPLVGRMGRLARGGTPGPGFGLRRNAERLARAIGHGEPLHYWRMLSHLTPNEMAMLMPDVGLAASAELDEVSPGLDTLSLEGALEFDQDQFLPNLNLAYVDRAAMAASVEVRVPILDESVVDLVSGCDAVQLIRDGRQKALLKDAARQLVPGSVVSRPKAGFGGPLRAWVQRDATGELRERVTSLADRGLVEADPARTLFDQAANGRVDCCHAVWAMVCLAAWQEQFGRLETPSSQATSAG